MDTRGHGAAKIRPCPSQRGAGCGTMKQVPPAIRARTASVSAVLTGRDAGRPVTGSRYDYLRDPAAIYQRSFALVREAADLRRLPASLRPLALRLAHAAGDVSLLDDLAWSR